MDELIRAVDELTRPAQLRREYADVRGGQPITLVENFTGYSLLEELIDAIEPRANSGERGGNGSHLPIDAGAFDLWIEVSYDAHWWARELSINRNEYPGKAGVPLLLRSVSVTAPNQWNTEQLEATARTCRRWAGRIRMMLHNQRIWRGVRGVPCDSCQVSWIYEKRNEEDREQTFKEPALIVHTNPATGEISYVMCRSCREMTWSGSFT